MRNFLIGALLASAFPIAAPAKVADQASPSKAGSEAAPVAETTLASLNSGPYRDDAMRLATSIMPRAAFSGMLEASVVNGFRIGIKNDGVELEKSAPGITAEFERSIVQALQPFLPQVHAKAVGRYARLFSRTFNEQEVAELTAFYLSPVGQKLIARKFGYLSSSDASQALTAKETTGASDIQGINRGVAQSLVQDLNEQDRADLIALTQKPVFARMRALQPTIDRLEAEQANEGDPEMDEAVTKAITDVLARHGQDD